MADCIYKDKEEGWCKLHSDWSEPMAYIEYCVEAPCPDKKITTNAARIRAMSDEELSVFLREVMCKGAALEACDAFWEDNSYEIDWLKQEVSE